MLSLTEEKLGQEASLGEVTRRTSEGGKVGSEMGWETLTTSAQEDPDSQRGVGPPAAADFKQPTYVTARWETTS